MELKQAARTLAPEDHLGSMRFDGEALGICSSAPRPRACSGFSAPLRRTGFSARKSAIEDRGIRADSDRLPPNSSRPLGSAGSSISTGISRSVVVRPAPSSRRSRRKPSRREARRTPSRPTFRSDLGSWRECGDLPPRDREGTHSVRRDEMSLSGCAR